MKFIDERLLELSKSLDYTNKKTIGIVVKTAEEVGMSNVLGLYIPKLLLGMSYEEPKEENIEINYDKIVNHENNQIGKTSVESRNYFLVMGLSDPNLSIPAYGKYEKVFVDFIDSDIKSMYYQIHTLANPGKRKGDKFRIGAISENIEQKNQDVESSKNNFYYMEFDTQNQRIIIQNSQVNNEKYMYSILLDAKNGTLSLSDGKRILNMNSNEDRVTIQNEADSLITLQDDNIDIQTNKLTITADSEIKIKTKKFKLETDSFDESSNTAKVNHKSLELSSTKGKLSINNFEMTNLLHKTTVPMVDFQVTALAVKGVVGCAGIATTPTPPSPSIPPNIPKGSSVSEMGNTTVKSGSQRINSNFGAVPSVRSPELQTVLMLMAVDIDKALMKTDIPLPPTSSATVGSNLNSISSKSSMSS